jgi:alkylation response protein AidB-like acyl-CoA dehydrogenase
MSLRDIEAILPAFSEREAADGDAYPAQNIAALHEAGILRSPFAAAIGGEGASLRAAAEAIIAIATASPSTALVASMPLGLAGVLSAPASAVPPEHRAFWQSQQEEVAAGYRAGRLYAACNSEAGAGGSLAATKTTATRNSAGLFELNGDKILASSGKYADMFFSTAKLTEGQPGAGKVEFFFVPTTAAGVEILADWDGFGMRGSESQGVRYRGAQATALVGFPDFIETAHPLQYFFCLFAAIPLGCVAGLLRLFTTPAPASPALRLQAVECQMRFEAARAYVLETAGDWRPGADAAYAQRVLRMKTFVTRESVRIAADLFALGGGRNYRRNGTAARLFADSFAGTALRPPLSLALETLTEQFAQG